MMETLKIKKMSDDAVIPTRAHPTDAGLDLYCQEEMLFEPGQGRMVSTGVAMAIPQGFVGQVADRSSLAKKGLKTAGGVIDAGYRGEVKVIMWNISPENLTVKKGERLAQLLLLSISTAAPVEVQNLDSTSRGEGGFGSTGR